MVRMAENFVPAIAGELVELRIPGGECIVGRLLPRDGCAIVVAVLTDDVATLKPGTRIEFGTLPPLELVRLSGVVTRIHMTGSNSLLLVNACTENFHWHPHLHKRRPSLRARPSLPAPIATPNSSGACLLREWLRAPSVPGLVAADR